MAVGPGVGRQGFQPRRLSVADDRGTTTTTGADATPNPVALPARTVTT